MENIPYREAIGSLLFASQIARPDISYGVNLLSRYCEAPGIMHWKGVKRILRYLKGTKRMELTYGRTENDLIGYCDSDWAGDLDTRRSTTGYVFTFGGSAISWNTKRQSTVALSTTEAEFMAMTEAAKEALWLKQLLSEILMEEIKPIKIYSDNKGALLLVNNNSYSARSKHIDIKYRFLHEKVSSSQLELEYLPSEQMPADMLTKACSCSKIEKHNAIIGLNNIVLE